MGLLVLGIAPVTASGDVTVTYTYDANGNRTAETAPGVSEFGPPNPACTVGEVMLPLFINGQMAGIYPGCAVQH